MKIFYVEVDTNDGDYVGKIVKVKDEVVEKFKSLIEKIKKCGKHNFPCCECDDKDELCDRYDISEEELEEFRDAFQLYVGEYGFHTITRIQEVTLRKRWI